MAVASGGRAAPRASPGRGRQPRQERVPGQHEPRNPHAAERRGGHGRRPGPARAERRRTRHGRGHPLVRRHAGTPAIRHSGQRPHRIRPGHDRTGALPSGAGGAGRGRPVAHSGGGQGGGGRLSCRPGVRSAGRGRRRARASGPDQSGQQRPEVHVRRRGQPDGRAGRGGRRAFHRHRHRRRLRRGTEGAHLRPLPAGGRLDHPALRRHRPGSGDFARTGRADGRLA
ncbi:hypothetical protein D3C85_882540 [compost metagenome]